MICALLSRYRLPLPLGPAALTGASSARSHFPIQDRNRCFFTPQWYKVQDLQGQTDPAVFSHGRVRSAAPSGSGFRGSRRRGPRAPWPPVLSLAHMYIHPHTLPPQEQGRQRPDDKATGFSLPQREKVVSSASLAPASCAGSQGGRAAERGRLHVVDGKVHGHNVHTARQAHCHFHSTSVHSVDL